MNAVTGWIIVGIAVLLTWVPIDIYLKLTRQKLLTTQMSDWLHNPRIGPFIYAAMAAFVVGFLMHFIMAHQ
jgi:hypothetical protein